MTTPAFSLEPEVEALIQEIARDPRSSFFKVERPASPRGLLQSWDRFSSASAGWTAAERHLLDAHREEVAFWMRTKVLVEVMKLPGESTRIWVGNSPDQPLPSCEDLHLAGKRTRAAIGSTYLADTLGSALERDEWSTRDLYRLAIAATGLAPCDVSWLRVSLTLRHLGHDRTRISLLRRQMEALGSDVMRGFYWESIGSSYYREKEYLLAQRAYEHACRSGPLRFHAAASMLANAILAGDLSAARRASRWTDESPDRNDARLLAFVANQKQTLRSSPRLRSDTTSRFVRQLKGVTDAGSREIAHAYL